jgi:hypothetical protein
MFVLSDIQALPVPQQLFAFAEAYLDTAVRQCEVVGRTPEHFNFAHGAVLMSLTYHATELFLKSAILQKSPNKTFAGKNGHNLIYLNTRYKKLYPDYELKLPFNAEELDLSELTPSVVEAILKHARETPSDQVHRYPVSTKGRPWNGLYGFIPVTFSKSLADFQVEIRRLKLKLFPT